MIEPYRMVEPVTFSDPELKAVPPWQRLDECYANEYEPQFPSPLELLIVSVTMPVLGLLWAGRWLYRSARDRGPLGVVVAVVGGVTLGALACAIPAMLTPR